MAAEVSYEIRCNIFPLLLFFFGFIIYLFFYMLSHQFPNSSFQLCPYTSTQPIFIYFSLISILIYCFLLHRNNWYFLRKMRLTHGFNPGVWRLKGIVKCGWQGVRLIRQKFKKRAKTNKDFYLTKECVESVTFSTILSYETIKTLI